MSAGAMRGVPIRSVPPVRLLQRQRQGLHLLRDHHQMHMIGHQAVPQQSQLMKLNVLPQELQVNEPLAIRSKDELPRIAPLRHVVRNINCNDTGQTRHLNKITENVPSVPRPGVCGEQVKSAPLFGRLQSDADTSFRLSYFPVSEWIARLSRISLQRKLAGQTKHLRYAS